MLEVRLALAGTLVCLAAVGMAAASAQGDAAFGRGLLELLIVGGPIAVGLYTLRSPVNRSFGVALLCIGFAWSLTALAESDLSVPHTIGRLATWLIFPCVVYLLLVFPPWATGYGLDHSLVQLPVFDGGGRLVHRRGVTPSSGLYFLGLPWQHTRGSALLGWVKDDAEHIARHMADRSARRVEVPA